MNLRLWSSVGSSEAQVLGGPWHSSKWREWIYDTIARPFDKALWQMLHRFHPSHRYNIARTGLPPGYYDADTIILHASMEQLCRWIDGRGGEAYVQEWTDGLRGDLDPHDSPVRANAQADSQAEALAIYRWWKRERPADVKREDELLMAGYSDSRWTTKPTENPHLLQMVFPEVPADKQATRAEHRAIEEKIARDDQAMLHRLIDIRESLW